MPSIRVLPDRVANQIAAGEVVERPAAVVKELVENALDAGATRIAVEFRHGGRSFMCVEDNGCGMDRDDALLCLERHATSKIAHAADLDRLVSFGFRGEALPSIASVSRFELQSRPAGAELGTEVLVNGGKLLHVRECGRAVGTRVTVTQLFNSVPARRKFLKSDATEAAHIIHLTRLYALAHPEVAFTLVEDGRTIFRSPACPSLRDRVTEIFGRQVAQALLPVEARGEGGMRLSGFVGRPGASRSTRHDMIAFVNRRPVESRALAYAVLESYQTSLPKGRYPLAFLFLELDPAAVDVNVHPAKREVRFRAEPLVRTFVVRTLLDVLRGAAVPGVAVPSEPLPPAPTASLSPAATAAPPRPALELPPPAIASAWQVPWAAPAVGSGGAMAAAPNTTVESEAARPAVVRPGAARDWRSLGVLHGDYLLFETGAGLVVLDQRGAWERILFEELAESFRAGPVASQRLLFAVPVELDPIASALLLDHLEFFRRHGLETSAFGRNFFRIEAAPAWLDPAEAEPFLREVLGRMREGRIDLRRPELAREELARLAAARAVRTAADRAGENEGLALVERLHRCDQPLLTPAGRPTYFEIGRSELARRFGRE